MALAPSRNTRRDTALPHKFHIRLPSITSIVAPALVPRRPVLFPLHPNLCRRSVRLQSLTGKLQDDPIPPGQLGSKRRRVTSSNENARGGLLPRLKRLRSDAYDAVNDGEANGMDIDNTLPSTHWSASTSDSDSTTPLSERRRRKPSRAISTAPSPPTTRLRSRKTNASSFSPPVPLGEPKLNLESLGLDNREIPPSKLQKLKKIGSGGFKDVFIGKFSGRRIAISEFRGRLTAMDIKELKLLGRFDHPNIIRFLGVSIPDNNRETPVMIITELCSNGDLFDNIRNVPAPSLNKVLTMMLDIARGLDYLHLGHPSVIHRDCKSSNILISAKGTAKIADFGLAKVKESTRSMVRSLVGTVNWQAPELWKAQPKYNHKVDVFSCAMVYWEMLQWHAKVKRFPWEGMNEHAIYEIVGGKKQRPSTNHLRKQWSTAIVDLIEGMWAHEHQDRPSMSEIVVALQEMNNDQAV